MKSVPMEVLNEWINRKEKETKMSETDAEELVANLKRYIKSYNNLYFGKDCAKYMDCGNDKITIRTAPDGIVIEMLSRYGEYSRNVLIPTPIAKQIFEHILDWDIMKFKMGDE